MKGSTNNLILQLCYTFGFVISEIQVGYSCEERTRDLSPEIRVGVELCAAFPCVGFKCLPAKSVQAAWKERVSATNHTSGVRLGAADFGCQALCVEFMPPHTHCTSSYARRSERCMHLH